MSQQITDETIQARAHFAAGDYVAAEKLFRKITIANPRDALAAYNLGVTLVKLDRFEDAIGCYRTSIELNPTFADAYANFGICLSELGLITQARQAFALARQLAPNDPIPKLNDGIAALALGDYKAGWEGFAARWALPAYAKFKRVFPQPEWQGEDLSGKTILLYAEQGFGDSIQMVRYAPIFIEMGAQVVLEVQPALTSLFKSLKGAPLIISKGEVLPHFDYHCAMMDVPGVFHTRLETIPKETPYLFAKAHGVAPLKPYRVGVCWAGRGSHENDRNRSLSFAELAPLFQQKNIEFVSLQRAINERDEAAFAKSSVLDWGRSFADFDAAAQAIMDVDLVISVDTAIAHLAGALGKQVLILLPFYADWRWLIERGDSPWYPTACLFRQKKRRDWNEVITRVAACLSQQFS